MGSKVDSDSFGALLSLLSGQAIVLNHCAKAALERNQLKADNDKALMFGFYTTIDAIEKVVLAQRLLSGNKQTDLTNYLCRLKKAAFRVLSIGASQEPEEIKQAMAERKHATIH